MPQYRVVVAQHVIEYHCKTIWADDQGDARCKALSELEDGMEGTWSPLPNRGEVTSEDICEITEITGDKTDNR